MGSIGDRIREERERLGIKNQTEFGQLGGVERNAQSQYERNIRCPDAEYLRKIAAMGVDILYVVTGTRATHASVLSDDERRLLTIYRGLQHDDKMALSRIVSLIHQATV